MTDPDSVGHLLFSCTASCFRGGWLPMTTKRQGWVWLVWNKPTPPNQWLVEKLGMQCTFVPIRHTKRGRPRSFWEKSSWFSKIARGKGKSTFSVCCILSGLEGMPLIAVGDLVPRQKMKPKWGEHRGGGERRWAGFPVTSLSLGVSQLWVCLTSGLPAM